MQKCKILQVVLVKILGLFIPFQLYAAHMEHSGKMFTRGESEFQTYLLKLLMFKNLIWNIQI